MTTSVAFSGIEATPIDIQIKLMPGIPGFVIVGLPDKVVAESKERVKAAIGSMGLAFPLKKIIVNLSPANLLKEGSHYDLPIAIGLLIETGILPRQCAEQTLIMGELSLDGSIVGVNGILPAAVLARRMGMKFICPWNNGTEAKIVDDLDIVAPQNLLQLIDHVRQGQALPEVIKIMPTACKNIGKMSKIVGHRFAKRAAEIALAGAHNMLMIGPPGSGKSLIAQAMAGLSPKLSYQEAVEVKMICSVSNEAFEGFSLTRPYRAPHHSCSSVAMIGGGRNAKPGEISLAHCGILFLDELPEFSRASIEALRQPMENRNVCIARAESHVTYPAKFQLIAAMNPCKCGYAGTANAMCNNQRKCVINYWNRISGPILDRIELFVNVDSVDILSHIADTSMEEDEAISQRIKLARDKQSERYADIDGITTNSETSWELIRAHAMLDADGFSLARRAAQKHNLSARSITKLFQVARTIADLAHTTNIHKAHMAEAIMLCDKQLDKQSISA